MPVLTRTVLLVADSFWDLIWDVAVAGDPLQTLPVDLSFSRAGAFVFRSLQWRSLFRSWRGGCRVLLGTHRQRGDGAFSELLLRLRVSEQTAADIAAVNATWDSFDDEQRKRMPQLRAVNTLVESYNLERLAVLGGTCRLYKAVDTVSATTEEAKKVAVEKLVHKGIAELKVKVAAPVVAVRRLSLSVPTGTVGSVVGMPSDEELVCSFKEEVLSVRRVAWQVFDDNGNVIGTRQQVPVLLSWALTIHRAQGSEIERVCIDFSLDDWACEGLVYAALSRVRSFSSLCVRGLTERHVKVSAVSLEFWRALVEGIE